MGRFIALSLLMLMVAVLVDLVVAPVILGQWASLHCSAAAVALIAIKKGRWWGLAAGWTASLLLGALSSGPFGMYMLSLGCMGFAGGFFRTLGAMAIPSVDVVLILLLLVFEDCLGGFSAQRIFHAHWHPAFAGILLTTLLMLFAGWQRFNRWIE